jgi:hypothetical protein
VFRRLSKSSMISLLDAISFFSVISFPALISFFKMLNAFCLSVCLFLGVLGCLLSEFSCLLWTLSCWKTLLSVHLQSRMECLLDCFLLCLDVCLTVLTNHHSTLAMSSENSVFVCLVVFQKLSPSSNMTANPFHSYFYLPQP